VLGLAACSTSAVTSPSQTEAVPVDTATPTTTEVDEGQFPTAEVAVGDTELRVWVADDPAERTQGLRQVEELPAEVDGVLFVWDTPTSAVFVMEDTLIPLDVWFFDDEGAFLGTHEMTPCADEPCPTYPAPGPVRWALETHLGDQNFVEGDRLSTSPSG
jgi:hypothetical protein